MIQERKIGDFSRKRKNWAEKIRRGYCGGEGGEKCSIKYGVVWGKGWREKKGKR